MQNPQSDILGFITGTRTKHSESIRDGGNLNSRGSIYPTDGELPTIVDPNARLAVATATVGLVMDGGDNYHYLYHSDEVDDKYGTWEEINENQLKIILAQIRGLSEGNTIETIRVISKQGFEDFKLKYLTLQQGRGVMRFEPHPTKTLKERYNTKDGFIPFNDGVYLIGERKLVPHDKNFRILTKLEMDFPGVISTPPSCFDEMINNLSGGVKEVRNLLEAFVLLSMTGRPSNLQRSVLHLYSNIGGTGKSTYCEMISAIGGYNRVKNLTLTNLANDGIIADLGTIAAAIFPDERNTLRVGHASTSNFLRLTTGEPLSGRRPYSIKGFIIRPQCVTLIASNTPITGGDDSGLVRRIAPVVVEPIKSGINPNFVEELLEEIPQIVAYILGKFSSVKEATSIMTGYAKTPIYGRFTRLITGRNNNIVSYLEDVWNVCSGDAYNSQDVEQHPTLLRVYRGYVAWLQLNNQSCKPMGRESFKSQLESVLSGMGVKDPIQKRKWKGYENPDSQRVGGLLLKSGELITPQILSAVTQ